MPTEPRVVFELCIPMKEALDAARALHDVGVDRQWPAPTMTAACLAEAFVLATGRMFTDGDEVQRVIQDLTQRLILLGRPAPRAD